MQTVVLVGTNHNYQCPVSGPYEAGVAQFRTMIQELCLLHHVSGIAEEMSLQALQEWNVTESVAQQVCALLRLKHQLSDPASREDRYKLGIRQDNDIRAEHLLDGWTQEQIEADVLRGSVPSDRIKERFWLHKVRELDVWPLLFICGANHFTSFTALLKENCINVVAAHSD